jgi:CRISPR-associated protein Cas5t
MGYLLITLRSRLASFRDPETQNYHRTLPLPPPSTCIGLAGAALGLAGPAAQEFFREGEWKLGVGGTSGGAFRDLWKYDDFRAGSIIWREYLYDNVFQLVFGHADEDQLRKLEAAFRRPVYALTCGNSDNVCLIDWRQSGVQEGADAGAEKFGKDIAPATPPSVTYGPCYLPGDRLSQALAEIPPEADLRIITGSGPTALELPVRYTFLKGGERMTRERRRLTYVKHLTLPQTYALDAFTHQGTALPLFPL